MHYRITYMNFNGYFWQTDKSYAAYWRSAEHVKGFIKKTCSNSYYVGYNWCKYYCMSVTFFSKVTCLVKVHAYVKNYIIIIANLCFKTVAKHFRDASEYHALKKFSAICTTYNAYNDLKYEFSRLKSCNFVPGPNYVCQKFLWIKFYFTDVVCAIVCQNPHWRNFPFTNSKKVILLKPAVFAWMILKKGTSYGFCHATTLIILNA